MIDVVAVYMTAGPAIMRTAERSFVARDMRSPVRWAWNHAGGRRSRWAKNAFRRSYSISRDAPMMIRRIRKRQTPAAHAIATMAAA